MKAHPKHMTAYVELEITDYKTFEQLVKDWSVTEQGCSGTLMFEWYISECKSKATLIETFADEEAQAVHMKNIETYGETFMACTNPQKFTYLGAVTDAVKERVVARRAGFAAGRPRQHRSEEAACLVHALARIPEQAPGDGWAIRGAHAVSRSAVSVP